MKDDPARFLDAHPLAPLLALPCEALDYFASTAFQLYQDARYAEAEIICRGLTAAAPHFWYPHALLATTLQKQGRFAEAIAACDRGLGQERGRVELLGLRAEILRSAQRFASRRAQGAGMRVTVPA